MIAAALPDKWKRYTFTEKERKQLAKDEAKREKRLAEDQMRRLTEDVKRAFGVAGAGTGGAGAGAGASAGAV